MADIVSLIFSAVSMLMNKIRNHMYRITGKFLMYEDSSVKCQRQIR